MIRLHAVLRRGKCFFVKIRVCTHKRLEDMMSTTHRGSQVITLLVTCLGLFMVFLDGSIVNVALPTIQADLHANLSDLQWVVDAYPLPFPAPLLPPAPLAPPSSPN